MIQMLLNGVIKGARGFWYLLRYDKTPLGVTLALAISAALGTYLLTPEINKTIQRDNARSEHVLKTIDLLNDNMINLSELIRKFNFEVARKRPVDLLEKRDAVLDKISAMQWRVIDASVIMGHPNENDHIEDFKKSLTRLQFAVISAHREQRTIDIHTLEQVSGQGYMVLDQLYHRAGLYESTDPANEQSSELNNTTG